MEERQEPHIFKCPKCPQLFKSAYHEIGLEMDCPQCGAFFRIPDIADEIKSETSYGSRQVNSGIESPSAKENKCQKSVYDTFSEYEKKLLDDLPAVPLKNLKILTRENCWEYCLSAILLSKQLEGIKQTVLDTVYKQEKQRVWKKNRRVNFNDFLQEYSHDLSSTLSAIYRFITENLKQALKSDNLQEVLEFSKKFDDLAVSLTRLHTRIYQEPIPQEEPYPRLQRLLTGWVPYCYESLQDFVNRLQEKCVDLRNSNELGPQISLISPSFPEFVKIMNQLGIGCIKEGTRASAKS